MGKILSISMIYFRKEKLFTPRKIKKKDNKKIMNFYFKAINGQNTQQKMKHRSQVLKVLMRKGMVQRAIQSHCYIKKIDHTQDNPSIIYLKTSRKNNLCTQLQVKKRHFRMNLTQKTSTQDKKTTKNVRQLHSSMNPWATTKSWTKWKKSKTNSSKKT